MAFDKLRQPACADLSKLAWWNDEDLKALSTRAVRAAPNKEVGHTMRAVRSCCAAWRRLWESGPRSAAEFKEAATHCERSAELSNVPVVKAERRETAAR